jgi:polysaccharide export outer membrane protein
MLVVGAKQFSDHGERSDDVKRVISCVLALLMAVAPASSSAQQQIVTSTTEYLFGPDDIIEITVFGQPELTGEVTVDFRGMIQIPLVGEVRAEGRSPSGLGEYLTERYQLLDSSISEVLVSVVEYKSRTVTVLGEVRAPGPYGFVEIPGLWDVILTAGGPGAAADLTRVQVVRGQPAAGESPTITLDLSAGIAVGRLQNLPYLRAGDKVFVPSAEDIPVGDQDFQILGSVGAPGTYRINVATNVIEALAASGGPTESADLKSVYVTRDTEAGTRSFRLNLEDYLFAANTPQNIDLLAGDTVTVPEKSGFVQSWATLSGLILPLVSLAITFAWASNR